MSIAVGLVVTVSAYAIYTVARSGGLAALKVIPAPLATPAKGFVEKLARSTTDDNRFSVHGWAVSEAGIDKVELILNGQERIPLSIGISRGDVAQSLPHFPDSAKAGFEGTVDSSTWSNGFKTLEVVVTDKNATTTVLERRTFPPQVCPRHGRIFSRCEVSSVMTCSTL